MIISSPTVCGTGTIRGAFPRGRFLALVSEFPVLDHPPGRTVYGQKLHYRVGLYEPGDPEPFAVFDRARHPINYVAFHPTESVIAVAGGRYDGGYTFEGELNLWYYLTGRSWPAIGPVPEVVRCHFDESGERLDFTVRPWNDDWDLGHGPDGDVARIYRLSVPFGWEAVTAQAEIDPATLMPWPEAEAEDDPPELRAAFIAEALRAWFGVDRRREQGAIWDLAWLDDGRLAAVHDHCRLEIHDLEGGGVTRFEGEGHGAAILGASPPVVHVASHPMLQWSDPWSRLLAIERDGLREIGRFEGRYSFTATSGGLILGRLDRYRPGAGTADLLIDIATGEVTPLDLGHYDCQNNYLGIDGAPGLYLLQAMSPDPNGNKLVCRLRADGEVEPLWPVLPPGESEVVQARWFLGCHVEDEEGPGIAIAGRHYQPWDLTYGTGFIYRKPIASDRELWRHVTRAATSAMIHIPSKGVIVAAQLDGTLLLLDAVTGEVRANGLATIENIPTIVYSMDASGTSLALGTFDGRIAVVEVDDLLAADHASGRIELA